MQRSIPWVTAVAVIVVVVLVIVGIWFWREHRARSYEERARQEVEQQLYQEKELGHPPGQVPAPPQPR